MSTLLPLLGLILAIPISHAEEPPVCIRSAPDGKLEMVPSPCPDPLNFDSSPVVQQKAGGGEKDSGFESPPTGSSLRTQDGSEASTDLKSQDIPAYVRRIARVSSEEDALRQFEVLVSMGESALRPLIEIFRSKKVDARERWVAGRALGKIRDPRSSRALIKGLKDSVPLVRIAAARALRDQGYTPARKALLKVLDDKGAMVRSAAIDALSTLGTREDVPEIAKQLTAPSNFVKGQGIFVRVHAVQALSRLGGPEAVKALIEVSDDADPQTRDAAREALLHLSQRSTVPGGPGTVRERWRTYYGSQP